jgi:hypothetical protein
LQVAKGRYELSMEQYLPDILGMSHGGSLLQLIVEGVGQENARALQGPRYTFWVLGGNNLLAILALAVATGPSLHWIGSF